MTSADHLMSKIKKEAIQPNPKGRFKNQFGLSMVVLSTLTILGSVAFSIILFAIQQVDFQLLKHLKHSPLEFLLAIIPSIWMVALIISLALIIYGIRNSQKGYKFSLAGSALYSSIFSILIGTLFFLYGGAATFERIFALHVDAYESIAERKMQLWSLPEEGYLSGTILETGNFNLTLQDFSNNTWEIQHPDAFIPKVVLLERGEKVKIIGKRASDNLFIAKEIRPWGGPAGRAQPGKKRPF